MKQLTPKEITVEFNNRGFPFTEQTIRRWMREGFKGRRLGHKVAGRWFATLEQLDDWIGFVNSPPIPDEDGEAALIALRDEHGINLSTRRWPRRT